MAFPVRRGLVFALLFGSLSAILAARRPVTPAASARSRATAAKEKTPGDIALRFSGHEPSIRWDSAGNLHMVFVRAPGREIERARAQRSEDGGATWSTPVPVNDDGKMGSGLPRRPWIPRGSCSSRGSTASTTLDTANGFTRLDHGLSGAAQLSLRYNIVSGSDLEDAMAKRAAYETQMSKRDRRANASKEPATFPSATPLAT